MYKIHMCDREKEQVFLLKKKNKQKKHLFIVPLVTISMALENIIFAHMVTVFLLFVVVHYN